MTESEKAIKKDEKGMTKRMIIVKKTERMRE